MVDVLLHVKYSVPPDQMPTLNGEGSQHCPFRELPWGTLWQDGFSDLLLCYFSASLSGQRGHFYPLQTRLVDPEAELFIPIVQTRKVVQSGCAI